MPAKKKSEKAGAEAKAPMAGRFVVEMAEALLDAMGGPAAVAERCGATLLGCTVNDRVARVELEA